MSTADGTAAAPAGTPAAPPERSGPLPPAHQRAATDLRQQILLGRLKPGAQMPAVRRLQQQYTITGRAVQTARHVLRAGGLTGIVPGRGSFVADPLPGGAAGEQEAAARRIEVLEETLRDVLGHIRPGAGSSAPVWCPAAR